MKELIKTLGLIVIGFIICLLVGGKLFNPVTEPIEPTISIQLDTVIQKEIRIDSLAIDSLQAVVDTISNRRNRDVKQHYKRIRSLRKARKLIGALNDSINVINLANKIQKGIECQKALESEGKLVRNLAEIKRLQARTIVNLKDELGEVYCKAKKLNAINVELADKVRKQERMIKQGTIGFSVVSVVLILLLL